MCVINFYWWVLAIFYFVLAIVTWVTSRPILSSFSALMLLGDSLVSYDKKQKKEVGLESTLRRAYKSLIITDVVGFVLASIAAIVSSFIN